MSTPLPGHDLRHPHGRRRAPVRAPHERAGAERDGARRASVGAGVDAPGLARVRRREDVEVARQHHGARRPASSAGCSPSRCASSSSRRTTASSRASRATRSKRRIAGTGACSRRPRRRERPTGAADAARCAPWRERFRDAVHDDLNAPRALAVAIEMLRDPALAPADQRALLEEFDAFLGLDLLSAELPADVERERPAHRRAAGRAPGGPQAPRLPRGRPHPRRSSPPRASSIEDTPQGPRWKRGPRSERPSELERSGRLRRCGVRRGGVRSDSRPNRACRAVGPEEHAMSTSMPYTRSPPTRTRRER